MYWLPKQLIRDMKSHVKRFTQIREIAKKKTKWNKKNCKLMKILIFDRFILIENQRFFMFQNNNNLSTPYNQSNGRYWIYLSIWLAIYHSPQTFQDPPTISKLFEFRAKIRFSRLVCEILENYFDLLGFFVAVNPLFSAYFQNLLVSESWHPFNTNSC